MQTLYSYSYNPVIATASPYITTQWRMAYKSPLILYKGIDNSFKIVVLNSSQKLVDLTNLAVEIRIVDVETNLYLLSKTAFAYPSTSGTVSFTLMADDMDALDGLFYNMVIRLYQVDTEMNLSNPEILYSDDNYSALLPVQVKSGFNATLPPVD